MSKLVGTVAFSEKRRNLLMFLINGRKTLEEIRTSLKVTSSGMIPQIRKLERQNLIRSEGKYYTLTETGSVIAEVLSSFLRTVKIIEEYSDFWTSHDIKAIPQHLLRRIHELRNCELIECNLSEIHESHKGFLESISKSKKIMGISPILHQSYPSFFLQMAQNGSEISLILTREVLDKLMNEYNDTLKKFLAIPTTRLYESNQHIKLACVVTDCYFNISLHFKNGDYDIMRDIVSSDHSAIKWGEDLFNHYLNESKELGMSGGGDLQKK